MEIKTVIPSVFFIGFHPGGGNILSTTTPSNLLGNFWGNYTELNLKVDENNYA